MTDKLIKIRRKFVDKISLANLKDLLDDLLEDKCLTDGEKDSVLEENSARADRARCLVDILKKKGNRSANSLFTHLEERDPELFSELGLSSAAKQPVAQKAVQVQYVCQDAGTESSGSETAPAVSGTESSGSETAPAVSGTESSGSETAPAVSGTESPGSETAPAVSGTESMEEGCETPLKLLPSTDVFKKEKLNNPNIYPMREKSSRKRLALLITNVEFDLAQMTRNGAEKDEENMLMLLNELGYSVDQHRNLSGKEMDGAVKKFSQDPRLADTDSVFVVIMSHGNLGVIKGVHWTPGFPGNNDVFQIENLYTHLNTQNCPALLDKPKVIIIQACRGVVDGSAIVHDGDIGTDAYLDTEGIEEDSFRAHKEKDFISLLSSTPYTVSYRHQVTGSFLIKYISEIFHKSAHEEHIEELFMKVMRSFESMPEKHGNIRQMPTKDRCTLTKHLYLFPGY